MGPTSSSRRVSISVPDMPGERRAAKLVKISGPGCRSGRSPIVVGAKPNPNQEDPMRYVLMIALDEAAGARAPELESDEVSPEYATFMKDAADRGVLLGGERLRLTTDATTVRVRNGEVLATDGPFAETKEQLAGYFLVDCKDLDEAIEVASLIPGARDGSIEVRPIWEH